MMAIWLLPSAGTAPRAVSLANLTYYLAEKNVACVGGTWIASREAIAEKKWAQIKDNCKAAIEIVKKARG